jgi:hypothetical protein
MAGRTIRAAHGSHWTLLGIFFRSLSFTHTYFPRVHALIGKIDQAAGLPHGKKF